MKKYSNILKRLKQVKDNNNNNNNSVTNSIMQ